jgi:hypothetical protein
LRKTPRYSEVFEREVLRKRLEEALRNALTEPVAPPEREREFSSLWTHVWTVRVGKVTRFYEYVDTAIVRP